MDYQGNSNKDKDPKQEPQEKKIDKVITGDAVLVPKGIGWKFRHIFLAGTAKQAGRYVVAEVIFPTLRNLAWEVVSKGSEKVIFGESTNRRSAQEVRSRIQYNNPLARRPLNPMIQPARLPDQYRSRATSRRDANDIVIPSREDAEQVVERLLDVLDKYDVVSLADLYDLLGLETSHVDQKWGWTYLNNVEIRQVREGYLIELPALEEI